MCLRRSKGKGNATVADLGVSLQQQELCKHYVASGDSKSGTQGTLDAERKSDR